MSYKESGKLSLSMLRGKPTNQSVPSISFRFDPSSNDITEVEPEENDESGNDTSFGDNSSEGFDEEKEGIQDASKMCSNKSWNQRSSSLDSSQSPTSEVPGAKIVDSTSLISRITKTFEHKISEIRNEKLVKDAKIVAGTESTGITAEKISFFSDSDKVGSHAKAKVGDGNNKVQADEKDKNETGVSPIRSKAKIVQDLTEHTNKLKSELHKSIRPKLSELRNRKNSRDSLNSSKSRGSLLTSLLGRDEGIVAEVLLKECDAEIDTAIEAEELEISPLDVDAVSNKEMKTEETEKISQMLSEKLGKPDEAVFRNYILTIITKQLFLLKQKPILKYFFAILAVCFFLPLPSFLTGFIFGIVLAGAIFYLLLRLLLPAYEEPKSEDISMVLDIPACEGYVLYKGWMNELEGGYFPESYHVSLTHSVFIRLQGSTLQIDHPRKRVGKHAKPHEELNSGGFVHHREYNLKGSEVILLPKNLPRKWLWSRKYPICLHLRPNTVKSTFPSSRSSPSISATSPELTPSEKDNNVEVPTIDVSNKGEDDMISALDLASYEEITEDMCSEKSLFLFARSDREKDDWFRRFVVASENVPKGTPSQLAPSPSAQAVIFSKDGSSDTEDFPNEDDDQETAEKPPISTLKKKLNYEHYMALILHRDINTPLNINWFNCLVGRILYDFLHNQFWAEKIQERVQRKLSKLHIPYFIGDILVCGVDLGSSVPHLQSVEAPQMDERGLWIDFSASYTGSFTMSLETKLDLMKLKERSMGNITSNPPSPGETPVQSTRQTKTRSFTRSPSSECVLRNVQFDTDTDDSVESSSEEEYVEEGIAEGLGGAGGGGKSKKFLRLVDSVATSKYFQHASEWKVLQRAIQGVSNTRIELSVQVKQLSGILTVNIPPPPSDRLWYGFRGSPHLVMVAKPCLGDRPLNLPFLAEFIQKQLRTVVEKVFVLPNMDDLVIPVMSPLLPGQRPPPCPWEEKRPSTDTPKTSPVKPKVSITSHLPSSYKVTENIAV